MRRAARHAKWGVAAACSFEAFSIATGKTPTVSELCSRYRWLGPAVLAALALHFYWHPTQEAS